MRGKVRKLLGVLTDLLVAGRKLGWWFKRHGPTTLDLDNRRRRR